MTINTLAKTTIATAIAAASIAPLASAQVGYVPELEAEYDAVSTPSVSSNLATLSAESDAFPQNRGDESFVNAAKETDGIFGFSLRNLF